MKTLKTLIFDFGDVFVNLDKQGAMKNALELFNLERFETDMISTNIQYELGQLSTAEFISSYIKKFPNLNRTQIIEAWNYIIKDFPRYRFEFIKDLADQNQFQLILLSNTNDLHIEQIKSNVSYYDDFKACFNRFYLSHDIHLRKPNTTIFKYVLDENTLKPEECLFIDDTPENTKTAASMGFHVWPIDERTEDVVSLFETKKELF